LRYIYTVLLYVLLPLLLLRLLLRSVRTPAYRQRLGDRLGFVETRPDLSRPAIWIHAVSVGEVVAARPLIEALLEQQDGHQLILTTTTPAGSSLARDLFSNNLFHAYLPWDTPDALSRFFKRIQPGLLLLVETELWPNLLAACAQNDCVALLVNARLSQRSSNRYRIVKPLVHEMFSNLAHIACQSMEDRDRFESLGMSPGAISVTGSLKAEAEVSEEMLRQAAVMRVTLSADERPVIVAGSTHEGEEEVILNAFARVREEVKDCLLVLAPRHTERCEDVFVLCKARGFGVLTCSSGEVPARENAVLLVDVMGELPLFYGSAALAILGGSFVPRGGHNVLEAAVWGVPSISGPSTYNFSSIYSQLAQEKGAFIVSGENELVDSICELLNNPVTHQAMSQASRKVVEMNRGACAATLKIVHECHADF
jgi:3-deoxy-D-manno-octulosonic-acid transferase